MESSEAGCDGALQPHRAACASHGEDNGGDHRTRHGEGQNGEPGVLDLVVVLDTSGSMHGRKLHDMKQAAEFVIRMVRALDTLTFVPFSSKAGKPSAAPPLHMSARAKHDASQFVRALKYFAKVLGILRDVSVLNLLVTLKPHAGATILEVHPGNNRVTPVGHGSSTIHFGDLAGKEHRRIFAVIQLPAVLNNERAKTVMDVECSYRLPKARESESILKIEMARDRSARPHAPRGHFQAELGRRNHAERIGKMKRLADANKFDEAMDELAEAKNALRAMESTTQGTVDGDLLDALSLELEHLEELLESRDAYHERRGGAYMLAAILSHDLQRLAARGGDGDVMLYALPRMLKYARQADEFHRNPNAAHI
ncbi:hypothetical protein BS78_05G234000 [Paspalum vaginatum]|nr:hypothetical protein BS78_05G234000 [Paspalum vaginatum]